MTTINENTTETLLSPPKRKRSPNKPKTDFKLAEIASKKYSKIMAREQAAVEKVASKIRDRFQTKKDDFLAELSDTVKSLVLAASNTQVVLSEPENPDVSDTEPEEDPVTAVAV